jgi:hypothetical protein
LQGGAGGAANQRFVVLYAVGVGLASLLYGGVVRLSLTHLNVLRALIWLTATGIFAVWLTFWVISLTDYDDADGWIDCTNSCSNLQVATGVTLFWGLAALALLVAISVLANFVGHVRGSGSQVGTFRTERGGRE